jgi:hypothetical protein
LIAADNGAVNRLEHCHLPAPAARENDAETRMTLRRMPVMDRIINPHDDARYNAVPHHDDVSCMAISSCNM